MVQLLEGEDVVQGTLSSTRCTAGVNCLCSMHPAYRFCLLSPLTAGALGGFRPVIYCVPCRVV
jgi:hypothetical protein